MMKKKHWLLGLILLLSTFSAPEVGNANVYDRKYFETRSEIVWEVPTEKKIVALTFDDGPDPEFTRVIADLLKKYNAKGTFFVIGENLKEHKEIAVSLYNEGHELANHSYTHRKFNTLSNTQMKEEIERTETLIEEIQKQPLKLLRPPTGHFDKRVVDVFTSLNYTTILWGWDQDTKDWEDKNSAKIAQRVLSNLSNGDIILMHDSGGNRKSTIQALQIILPKLQELGYKCVTVTELLNENPNFAKKIKEAEEKNLHIPPVESE